LNVSPKTLIGMAYNLDGFQLSGGPGWIASNRYDIVAKPPAGSRKDQTWIMLPALLADRFKLVIHRETRDLPV
jgi:uncharacterized protein (TIGR03435 family)